MALGLARRNPCTIKGGATKTLPFQIVLAASTPLTAYSTPTPKEIDAKLRARVDVPTSPGQTVANAVRARGVTEGRLHKTECPPLNGWGSHWSGTPIVVAGAGYNEVRTGGEQRLGVQGQESAPIPIMGHCLAATTSATAKLR